MSKIFKKVPIEVQNRSGANCDHTNSFSALCGQLVPILVDPIIPNTTVSLDCAVEVQLPPAVSDFYGTIEARLEFFFVPNRILWAGWKDFITTPVSGVVMGQSHNENRFKYLPQIKAPNTQDVFGPGSLMDYLGHKGYVSGSPTDIKYIKNALPIVAYNKIYDDWYRDSRITNSLFYAPYVSSSVTDIACLPQSGFALDPEVAPTFNIISSRGENFSKLRQRCWDKDYFTNATTAPQAGNAASVEFDLNITGVDENSGIPVGNASFSISALRAANSLQQFEERNNLAGQRYADQIYARFGCYPADAVIDRAIYLGSKRFNVYKRTVYQQSSVDVSVDGNPFDKLLANKVVGLSGYGDGKLGKFHATEHGFIFVMFSLVPQATYSSGSRRYLHYSTLTDFPDPLLQGVGDQQIYGYELGSMTDDPDLPIFGYTQRYSEAKFMVDEVHGLLRDDAADPFSLKSFQLQRHFTEVPALGTSFVEIPIDYLDQISNVDAKVSHFGCWCNAYFQYRKTHPLAAYSLPTLGEPKDTHTQIINNGGTRL